MIGKISICMTIYFISFVNISVGQSNFEIELLFEIGTQNDQRYMFESPNLLEVDSKGNIFVVDNQGFEVRVFDKSGIFKHVIGEKGRGPGDFLKISSLNVIEDDSLIIFDDMNQRFSKIVGQRFISFFPVENLSMGFLDVERILENRNKYLVLMNSSRIKGKQDILFVTDRSFSKIEENHGEKLNLWNIEDEFTQVHSKAQDALYTLSTNGILFATPKYYENYISRIDLRSVVGTKFFTDTKSNYESYKVYPEEDFDKKIPNKVLINRRENKFVIQAINRSLGLFYEDGFVLQFFIQKIDEIHSGLFLNYFSEKGKFLKSRKVKQFDSHPVNTYKVLNYSKGKLFVTDGTVIRVYKFEH